MIGDPHFHIHLGLVPAESRNISTMPASLVALVPAPVDNNITVKPSVPDTEKDTMPLIIKKAKRTAWQTKKLAAKLKGTSLSDTLLNDSNFILDYIKYKKDDPEHEQIRSPRRLIYERAGDCDCFAVTLSTLLINQGIKFKFRIARYSAGDWAHIYIIVPNDQSTLSVASRTDYTVLDPVTNKHNYEVSFVAKKDYDMSLQYLDGFRGADDVRTSLNGLGCGCGVPNNAAQKSGPKKIYYTSQKALASQGITQATDLLNSLKLPYTQKSAQDGTPYFEVTTPSGTQNVPALISAQPSDQDQLTSQLMAPVTRAVGATVATVQNFTPDQQKTALLWLLGISIATVVLNSGRSKRSEGVGALPKKLPTVRI